MIGHEYYQLYNRFADTTPTIEHLLSTYLNFICHAMPHVRCGFASKIDHGCFTIVSSFQISFASIKRLSLQTPDIHKDVFSLKPIMINSDDFFKNLTFLPYPEYDQLYKIILTNCDGHDDLITLNIYYDDFLQAQLSFIIENHQVIDDSLLSELSFIRTNMENILYKRLSFENDNHFKLLMDTAESILTNRHYITADSSDFLSRLLTLAIENTDEVSYGSALVYSNGYWRFVATVGHDLERLSEITFDNDIFMNFFIYWEKYQEVSPNIYVIDHILDAYDPKVNSEYIKTAQKLKEASMPTDRTIQLHIQFNGITTGVISLDKKVGSKKSFSKKTINLLHRIHFLGQILFTYSTLNSQTSSFENLIKLISKLIVTPKNDDETEINFLHAFLELLVKSLPEADFASAYIRDKKGIHYLDAIGHDIKALQELPLRSDYFAHQENIHSLSQLNIELYKTTYGNISATLFTDILKFTEQTMPPEIFKPFQKASKPIKYSLVSQAKLDDNVYINISCDIKEGSHLKFSRYSLHLFSVLTNLGYAFLANQYYIEQYKKLHNDLEQKIASRTKELETYNQQLRSIVNKDSLTNLFNHKTIIKKLHQYLDHVQTISIFLFDIDHFKLVNDTYGHQVGDSVLVDISQILLEDTLTVPGRYGGEEFLILMPNKEMEAATTYCHEILDRIRTREFIKGKTITVSGGIVAYKKGTATEMIQLADTLLYKAKKNGRDRIESAYC